VRASLAGPAQNQGEAAGDTYTSIERLAGSKFADTLTGDALGNVLTGSGGADTLDSGAGFDFASYFSATMAVTVSVSNPAANTGEAAGDRFIGIEGLASSAFNDTLTGDKGDNWLVGQSGADVLDGGAGYDTAAYTTAMAAVTASLAQPSANTGEATAGAVGALASGAFYKGTAAHASSDRIIYNQTTGALLYDADGTGTKAAVQFATVSGSVSLTASDFTIV
jgi:Ca2+-binding RTX toxin-like protein